VPIDASGLDGKVQAMRRICSRPGAPDEGGAAAGLGRQLLDPVLGHIRGDTLTIVPHGILHHLPFCALPAGNGLLIDRFSLRMLPSASVLTYLRPKKPITSALILGNPDLGDPALDLQSAQGEAQDLAAILPQPALFLRKEATAARVLASHGRYGIIHLAAHGFFDEASPLDSGLLLAPDPSAAGTLKVADLYHLDLDADLVTLSACETALAAVSRGDDVVGFTRGLLFAGSRSILSSLWKVDDQATRDLMLDFYRNMDTLGKAGALRHAQLEVRRGNPQPYYWAAFMMTGNFR
jgi:CHAT domain-containing protein